MAMTSGESDRGQTTTGAVLAPARDGGGLTPPTSAADEHRVRGRPWRGILQLIPVVVAMLVWGFSLPGIDIRGMTDLGLVSVLTPTVYVALGLLTFSFCFTLLKLDTHWIVPALHLIALIVIIHGTPAILYDTLRYSWAWKHVGIVDYIQRNGSVDPSMPVLQAYHSWPGFFALVALLTETAGLGSALSFASWGPVFFNILFAGALLFVFRSLTTDMRLVWFAVWLFVASNWVGQDYFSPQAENYFLYLVILGICLHWFRPFISPFALDRLTHILSGNGEQSRTTRGRANQAMACSRPLEGALSTCRGARLRGREGARAPATANGNSRDSDRALRDGGGGQPSAHPVHADLVPDRAGCVSALRGAQPPPLRVRIHSGLDPLRRCDRIP